MYWHHCSALSIVNFYLKWRNIMKTVCWKCHKELLVHYPFSFSMIYVMEIVSMLWKVKPQTWNIWGWILQRTLAFELPWEIILFNCYEGESKIAFLKFMLQFAITSLLRFPYSDVKNNLSTKFCLDDFFKQVLIMKCSHNHTLHMINLQKAIYLREDM